MKASVFIPTSLDGFIARQDGTLDWLPKDAEPHGYDEFMATVDALVIGRKTFDIRCLAVREEAGHSAQHEDVRVESARRSRVRFHAGTPHEIVARLTERGMKHLCIDGGVTVRGFLEAGLIQRFIIMRMPVLLEVGVPLFGRLPHDIRLELVATRSYGASW